ncbi:MAG TPA: glycosyltransferase [Kofleriaceae bacterium]|nr:glycosyltransferase [Kofleriaceae bacterium]
MSPRLNIAFFGSSLVSAYWNGAATYYRGIVRALAERGHRITFYEPDAFERQQHRDIEDPAWAKVVVYPATAAAVEVMVERARGADLVVKASGVGVHDHLLEQRIVELAGPRTTVAFWDVDAPATLDRLDHDAADPFHALVPRFDLVFTYGGGQPVVDAYLARGARRCVPIYNALDPRTHHPVAPDPRFSAALGFLGNRLPDREQRVDRFFFEAAGLCPDHTFLLGGAGWADKAMPRNVRYLGHVFTRDHNAFNVTPTAVLNISRDSMAAYGFSPATRVFEAAGAGACLITDAWVGIEQFLAPDREVLVAHGGDDVARLVADLEPARAREIGQRARERMLREHTYAHRALDVEAALGIAPAAAASRPAGKLRVVVLGLSLTSSWGNGHATTYRGLLRELAERGHDITFLERDVPWYAAHRDLVAPAYARLALYADLDELRDRFTGLVRDADVVIVGSYVPDGVAVGAWVTQTARGVTAFYDIDTPVTLAALEAGTCSYLSRELIPRYALYLSFTGGPTLRRIERELGAPRARALYCSVDLSHYGPELRVPRWDLGYMGTYSDDRQPSLHRLLLEPARREPARAFVVAGPQYPAAIEWTPNIERIEHLAPDRHRGFYNELAFTLNLTRQPMIDAGWSPSVRLFEAAACGVPILSDAWHGLDELFEPEHEILIVRDSDDVLRYLRDLGDGERRAIGARARARVCRAHSAAQRAAELEAYVRELA